MGYVTYTTNAIVCGHAMRASSDKVLYLFTEDAGMVEARATSVREERSKMRFALTDCSYARVSLVRGRYGWKVIGATAEDNLYFSMHDRYARAALRNILRLIRRLVPGEETHHVLFDILKDGFALLREFPHEARHIELLVTLRILSALGYIAPKEDYREYIEAPSLADVYPIQTLSDAQKRAITKVIEEAFSISQL